MKIERVTMQAQLGDDRLMMLALGMAAMLFKTLPQDTDEGRKTAQAMLDHFGIKGSVADVTEAMLDLGMRIAETTCQCADCEAKRTGGIPSTLKGHSGGMLN